MAKTGCCTDCSNVGCDDRCIEAVAELECRLSCGSSSTTPAVEHDHHGNDCHDANNHGERHSSGDKVNDFHNSSLACSGGKEDRGCCNGVETCEDNQKASVCSNETNMCCNEDKQVCYSGNDSGCCKSEVEKCCSQSTQNEPDGKESECCPNEVDGCCSEVVKDDCTKEVQNESNSKKVDECCASTRFVELGCKEKSCCGDDHASVATTDTSVACGELHKNKSGACVSHLQKAFERYTTYVEKGICICRDVLSKHGKSTCCGKVADRADSRNSFSVGTASGIKIEKHCCVPRRPLARKLSDHSSHHEFQPSGKVADAKTSSIQDANKACKLKNSVTQVSTDSDLEKGEKREHVLLNVTGMTCSGCGRKVENVLKRIEGIVSSQVTFVSGLVELEIDGRIATSDEIIQRLEKETGFKCSPVITDCQSLDVLLNDAAALLLTSYPPNGVQSLGKIKTGVYRISYNPTKIGARSLLTVVDGARLAPPTDDIAIADGKKRLLDTVWATALAAVLTIPVLVLAWADTEVSETARLIVSLVLATFVQAIAIPEFYLGALKSLIYSHVVETDMLVVMSISAAYGYSVVASILTFKGHSVEVKAFFETSTLLITLVLFGRLMAALARMKAVSAVSLRSLQADTAVVVLPSGETEEIDARLLQLGDVFLVRPYARVVTDGEIIDGQSAVDESIITGECIPVVKNIGDVVIAGTINGSNVLAVRLTRLPGKNSITDIASLVENALGAKPRIQNLADKFASYFIPVVILIALAVFTVWFVIALKLRDENGGGAFGTAITYSIAVLAITCPCALGLAVPMVLVIAGGVAARAGIIVKQADAFERARKVSDVVFDKTGTLTTGTLMVVSEHIYADHLISRGDILSLAKTLTQTSEHPVSQAVHIRLQHYRNVPLNTHNLKSIPGAGIECTWKEHDVKIGNPFWLGIEKLAEIVHLLSQGLTLLCLTSDKKVLAIWGLKASTRTEAGRIIHGLQLQKVRCHIVSGDNSVVVNQIASELRIPLEYTAARQSPADKQKYVEQLMKNGRTVLFCGDGTNDAVAVAQADIGVQIESTSDMTRAIADVVLLGGLEGIPALLILSKRVFRRIQFNFLWSAVYNIFAVLLAAGAFVKVRIPPAYAGLGEIVSIAPVIIAAMTLSKVGNPRN